MSGLTPPRAGERVSAGPEPSLAENTSPLALAYAAYRRTGPSEREVSLAVVRLQARLGGTRRRFRAGSLLAFAVVFVGALAYAAGSFIHGGILGDRPASAVSRASKPQAPRSLGEQPDRPSFAFSQEQEPAHEPKAGFGELDDVARADRGGHAELGNSLPPARETSSARTARPSAAKPSASKPSAANQSAARGPAPSGGTATPSAGAAPSGGTATPSADRGPAGAWSVVAESMAVKDYARAEGALRELARSGVSDTRDNATLGLAQLALGRGDCTEARGLAQRVLRGAPNPQARRRSEEVLIRCAPR